MTHPADPVFRTVVADSSAALRALPGFMAALAAPESGIRYIEIAVEAMSKALEATSVFVAHRVSEESDEVRVVCAFRNGVSRDPFSYRLKDQPCRIPYDGEPTLIPCELGDAFPTKREAGYQSFVGIPLRSLDGNVLGHIAVYDQADLLHDGSYYLGVAQAFGMRIACELQRHLEHDRLMRDAETCTMTGLLNRRGFESRAQVAVDMARRAEADLAAVAFDLDRFKQVNDTYGHAAGDELLIGFASCLGACFHRDTDVVARLGGDEFVLLAAATPKHQARRLAEEVRLMFEASPVRAGSETIFGTCSFGVAMLEKDPALSDLLERADQALYDSKAERRMLRES
jgi:diguanylate cyclase (GGDEF)-like protein